MSGACPPEDELVRLVEGALGDASLAAIERHVDTCEKCAAVIGNLGAMASAAARPRAVGRYQLDRLIGAGGMGEVWAAWDPQLRRDVAVKLVKPSTTDAGRERDRLLREARALARLTHPNVLAVYDVGEIDGEVFIATELVVGDTLASRGGANADWRQLARLYAQAARGLAAAHAAGLVHRDVKPANLLLGADGRVRVADFGLAVRSATPSPHAATELAFNTSGATAAQEKITQTGYIAGTPAYMAPEQRLGEPADARADQYALCIALAEGISGRRPPLDIDHDKMIAFVEERRPRDPDLDRLCGVLARGLSIDREDRFPDADALAAAIEACVAPSGVTAAGAKPRARWPLALVGAAALAGVAGVIVVWQLAGREPAAVTPSEAVIAVSPADALVATPDAAVAVVPPPLSPDATATVAIAPPLPPDAAATVAVAPPVKTPMPATPKTSVGTAEEIDLGLAAARRALNRRDGRTCLATLDKLPKAAAVMTNHMIDFHRGQCEMLAGDCERGKQRVNTALDAMGSPPNGDDLAIALCPISGPFEMRMKQITLQAHTEKSPAGCRTFIPHAKKLAGEATAQSKPLLAGVFRHLATCVGGGGDCAEAEALWRAAHALDQSPNAMEIAKCAKVTPAAPVNPITTITDQLAKAQQAILRRDLKACREFVAATQTIPQGMETSVYLIQGYCTMVGGNCKAGADLVAKAYNNAHPTTVAANVDTYCPIAGTLDERLGRIRAQLGAFADHRSSAPTVVWCAHLANPAKTAAREAQTDAQRALAAKNLYHLAWCMSTAGRCGEATDLGSLAAATDPDATPMKLSAKCP